MHLRCAQHKVPTACAQRPTFPSELTEADCTFAPASMPWTCMARIWLTACVQHERSIPSPGSLPECSARCAARTVYVIASGLKVPLVADSTRLTASSHERPRFSAPTAALPRLGSSSRPSGAVL
uniref:Uncharacterized protein n=1 Tax=Alexandrium monilatum TaxID=311494 RepID=A0A7S4V4F5_9DINO